jgi:hypothetical protein
MKPPPKSSILFLLLGMMIGALLMQAATPTTLYKSVILNLQFLLREGDGASATAALDRCVVSYGGESYLSRAELTELDRALRGAATKHVE